MNGQRWLAARRSLLAALAGGSTVVAGGLAVALLAIGGAAPASAAPSNPNSKVTIGKSTYSLPSCPDTSSKGALHTTGKLILKANNAGFAYYGISTYGGLETGGTIKSWTQALPSVMAQIKAAPWWHANTVRLQVNEQNAFNYGQPSKGLDTVFLKDLCQEVQQIRRQGEEVVISDQTEWPDWNESDPTQRTVDFWTIMGTMFKNQPGFSFDLYNEPRLICANPPENSRGWCKTWNVQWIWKTWRNGGRVSGTRYVGMQQLYDSVRATDPNVIIWIEGPLFDDTLGNAANYAIQNATGIVWSVHHPLLNAPGGWNKYWAYLARSYPMVDGEWAQYAAAKPECQANSEHTVPVFLKYLRSRNIGMLGWSLQPGAMLADPHHYQTTNSWISRDTTNPANLRIPSRMWPNYTCSATKTVGEGAGRQLMNYFKAYSHIPSV